MPSHRQCFHSAVFALVALVMTACSPTRPPVDDLDAAQRALSQARAAGGADYAPLELRNAEQHLDQAQSANAVNDYDNAGVLARESLADSDLARAKARLGKARAAVDTLKQQNAQLRADLGASSNEAEPDLENQP